MMEDPNADPDGDGQPDPPEAKLMMAQQMLQQAAVQPFEFEDLQSHAETHGNYMKSTEYKKLPPEVQQNFLDHYMATVQKIQGAPQVPEPRAVQTTLQLKGTIGPTAAAEILNKGGVLEVTPEQMAEQPLETWVTDSLDKPDVEEAGNDPFTQAEQVAKIDADQRKAEMHELDVAHKAALAHAASNRQAVSEQVKLEQSGEAHEQKMRHAEMTHRQQMVQASQQSQSSGE
jgi:hypothetical protein